MAEVYLFLADGFETIEALTPLDVLRRCGISVVTLSISDSLDVTSSHGLSVRADQLARNARFEDSNALILPGGYPGYAHLAQNDIVASAVQQFARSGKCVAAICGAPSVLQVNGVFEGYRLTCHSSIRDRMQAYDLQSQGVVEDRNLITAAGAGWSLDFAIAIARRLTSAEKMAEVRRKMELK